MRNVRAIRGTRRARPHEREYQPRASLSIQTGEHSVARKRRSSSSQVPESGIGKATALAFLEDGWRVALVGRRKESLEETAQAAGANRQRALVVPADVGKPDSVQACFARVKEVFGRVDALFNNAGQNAPGVAFEYLSYEKWQSVVDANFTGTFLCAQAAFRIMKDQDPRGGRIINNGSISAHTPRPDSRALHCDETRRERPHAHDGPRRSQIRHRCLSNRRGQRDDRARLPYVEGREAGE